MPERADGIRPVVVDDHAENVGVRNASAAGHAAKVCRALRRKTSPRLLNRLSEHSARHDDRDKLIRYPQVDRTQLFDLVADPDERTDLSARPEHAARIAALAAEMERLEDPAELTVASPRPAAWSPPPARGKK